MTQQPCSPEIELLPCPFCGGEPLDVMKSAAPALWKISCKNCDAAPSSSFGKDAAIKKWNTRASQPATPTGGEIFDHDMSDGGKALAKKIARSSAGTVDALAKTIWLAEFERAFSRTPTDPWENQAEPIKNRARNTAQKIIDAGFVTDAQAAPDLADHLQNALRIWFNSLPCDSLGKEHWQNLIRILWGQPISSTDRQRRYDETGEEYEARVGRLSLSSPLREANK